MPARDSNLGGIQKIVAGGARPGLIFRRDSFFSGGNPAKTPGRQSPAVAKSPIVTLAWFGRSDAHSQGRRLGPCAPSRRCCARGNVAALSPDHEVVS